jgi:hypothetical protein
MITNDKRCTHEIKCRIVMVVARFNNNKAFSTSKLKLNLMKKRVKCYIWSIALCGALTRVLWKVDQQYLGSVDMWCWRRMEIIRTDGGKMRCYKEPRGKGPQYIE